MPSTETPKHLNLLDLAHRAKLYTIRRRPRIQLPSTHPKSSPADPRTIARRSARHTGQGFRPNTRNRKSTCGVTGASHAPQSTATILVITGTKRDEAARKLRNLLDPVVHPLLEIPYTNSELGQLALTNKVLAFSVFKYIAPSKIEALNKLQSGMLVKLKEVNKRRGQVWNTVSRPIIISAGESIQISANQINLEINEAACGEISPQLFGALLNMIVTVLNQIHSKPMLARQVYQPTPPPSPTVLEQTNAPYT